MGQQRGLKTNWSSLSEKKDVKHPEREWYLSKRSFMLSHIQSLFLITKMISSDVIFCCHTKNVFQLPFTFRYLWLSSAKTKWSQVARKISCYWCRVWQCLEWAAGFMATPPLEGMRGPKDGRSWRKHWQLIFSQHLATCVLSSAYLVHLNWAWKGWKVCKV